jgi:hypothetical protein
VQKNKNILLQINKEEDKRINIGGSRRFGKQDPLRENMLSKQR